MQLIIVILIFIKPIRIFAQQMNEQARINLLFNSGWKFHMGVLPGAETVTFDDSQWRSLDLPHDFQMEQPWDQKASPARGFKPMGEGWYRKSFMVETAWKGKRILLDFEGIMLTGDVWLNGKPIGSADYGYLGFESDITNLLNYDKPNVVAVHATTGNIGASRWYTGGGLFRDVHIVVKDSISIARHGVFITTPAITPQMATVRVQVEVEGITNKRLPISLNAKIFSPGGKLVGEINQEAPQGNKLKYVEVLLPAATVADPQLWSCETPNLYTVVVSLTYENKLLDRVTESFGIRTLEFSNEYGFKLNGQKVFLKGIANHHDLGVLGAAVYDFSIERLFRQLKAFGYNHVRTSHNPYSESFLRLADKYGILIVDELADKWSDNDYWPGKKPFSQLWHTIVPEWIKRDRNHPSVIMWSFGNELQMREDLSGFATNDWGVTTYKIMQVLSKRYDTTRKTTVAMFPARAGALYKNDPEFNTKIVPPELATVTDVASFNYRYYNYQDYLKHAPHMIMYQSEASTNELAAPYFGMDYKKMVGLAYWGAVEYWGESNGWPKKGWNYSYFNHSLEPYPQAYLIKSAFSIEPIVHIGVVDSKNESLEWNDVIVGKLPISSHWNRDAGSRQNLFTYTNAQEVELLVNGKSVGVQKNNLDSINRRNMIYWPSIAYENGGTIMAIAKNNGKEVARYKLETTGKAVALKVVVENDHWKGDGQDLQYIKVYAVDSKGRVVPTAKADVAFDCTEGAIIMATDNGDHLTNQLFNTQSQPMNNGFAMAILRSTHHAGKVTLNISATGIKKTVVTLVMN